MVEIIRDASLVWKGTYPVRASEIDPHGNATLDTICNFLQESAGQHAHTLGVSVPQLLPQNLTWILARLRVDLSRFATWHDKVMVETWPAGAEKRYALRDFRIFDHKKQLIGMADTGWMMLDLAKKRPIHLTDEIRNLYPAEMGRAFETPFAKLPSLPQPQHQKSFAVRFWDLDLNRHVNNVSYIIWLIESVPDELLFSHYPAGLEVEYRAEAVYGDRVLAQCEIVSDASHNTVALHSLVREADGKELARARTSWKEVRS